MVDLDIGSLSLPNNISILPFPEWILHPMMKSLKQVRTFETLILNTVCDMFVICVAYALWHVCTLSKYVICLCL